MSGDRLAGPGRSFEPDELRRLVLDYRDLKARVDDMGSQILRSAGLRAEPDLLRVLGSLVVEGDLSVPSGTVRLAGVDRDLAGAIGDISTLQGQMSARISEISTLVSQQVAVAIASTVTTTGWTVSTSHATKASTSITVPSGYSQGLIAAFAAMHFQDSSPNGGWVRSVIAGAAGDEMGGLANLNIGQSAAATRAMGGLSGGTITIEAQVRASAASAVTTGRIAQIGGFGLFLR